MASEVDICNGALLILGAKTITALTEDADRARVCNARYKEMRDLVIESHAWSCAIYRDELTQDATDPEYGYDYRYVLPTSPLCLRVLEMKEGLAGEGGYAWEVEGRYLVTDSGDCTIKYIGKLTDPVQMAPSLRQSISARLAAEIAYKITGSKSMVDYAWKVYLATISEARMNNAIQVGDEELHTDAADSWLSARS